MPVTQYERIRMYHPFWNMCISIIWETVHGRFNITISLGLESRRSKSATTMSYDPYITHNCLHAFSPGIYVKHHFCKNMHFLFLSKKWNPTPPKPLPLSRCSIIHWSVGLAGGPGAYMWAGGGFLYRGHAARASNVPTGEDPRCLAQLSSLQ